MEVLRPRGIGGRKGRSSRGTAARFARALLLVAGILGILATGARPARVSAATSVTVRLTIQGVAQAGECFEGDAPLGGCLGKPDFYTVVRLNGGDEIVSSEKTDQFAPTPTDWIFSVDLDWDTTISVPIHIELYDADGGARAGDDHADISPQDGPADLDLTLTLGRVPCTFAGSGVSGTCGVPVDVTGAGDDEDDPARIIFRIDVVNNSPDSDGDGIPNSWEQNGVRLNGQFIDLRAMGADPSRPDIFIHLDWMQDTANNQALSNAALQQVVAAFANSPYISPTGSVGINVHIDQGPTSTLNFGTGATWGGLSRAKAITWQRNLGAGGSNTYDWTQFQALKSANFEPTGRSPIFHYAIAAFLLQPPPVTTPPTPQDTSSGISRNDPFLFANGTSDLIVSLGGIGCAASPTCQAGTLMHELGHNLGLQHGGGDSVNYKPNYLSIMNYLFQFRGLDVGPNTGVLDYSRTALGPLDERSLNEANGLGLPGFGTGSRCPLASPSGSFTNQYTANANAPYDWNCNNTPATNGTVGAPNDGVQMFDANSNGAIDTSLAGFDDWSNITFKGGQIGQLGAPNLPLFTATEPPLPWDFAPPTTAAQVDPGPNGNGWNQAAVTVTLHATDNPGGFGVRDITYSATGAQPIGSTSVIGDTVSFPIGAEGITTITFAARDQALNVETARTVAVRVDLTNPTVTLGTAFPPPNAAGWNNTDVSVPFTATDTPSGIASTNPSTSPLVLTSEGTAVTGTVTATDLADRTTSVTTPAFKIDKTPPVITVTSPAEGQVFDSDQTLTPVFGATDSLSGMKSLTAVLDTGQVLTSNQPISLGLLVGKRTLTVTATDVADNVATTVISFRVRPVFVGVAYDDPNESALREGGEAPIGGLLVFLDSNGNGRPDAGEPSNATNSAGAFRVVGEEVGPARLCTMPVASTRVRTTSRCQTVVVATGIPVPKVDFGSRERQNGCKTGGVAAVIQSIALPGRPGEYWRPAQLAGTASGPYAGSRLTVKNGGANPEVQVGTGERVATGLFVGGVDAATIGNLALDIQYQKSHQDIVAIVAADGTMAMPTTSPTTSFAYAVNGNQLTIYGVPQDGLGGYQDVWLITQITAANGNVTVTAGIAGTVVSDQGKTKVQALGNTCNDTAKSDIAGGLGGPRPGALLVDDIPDAVTRPNPY